MKDLNKETLPNSKDEKPKKYETIEQLIEACYNHLDSNLIEGERWGFHYRFYKPSNTKYGPYQWLWDSGWHMIVNSYRNPEYSIEDLRTMLQMQQPNGFVPEMIFWGAKKGIDKLVDLFMGYSKKEIVNPKTGEKLRGVFFTDISQMPMLAYSLRAIYNATQDVEYLKEFTPKLVKYLDWWHNERDPDKDGLISIIHPWESGIDASPLYDPAHGVDLPEFKQLYPKFLKLLWKYKHKAKWDQNVILNKGWFNVEDIGVCSVYADGWRVLGDLAAKFDKDLEKHCIERYNYYRNAIISKAWNSDKKQFLSFFHKDGSEHISYKETIQSLFPILLEDLPKEMEAAIIDKIKDSNKFNLPYPIPSTAYDQPEFNPNESRLLWRGPTWPCTTWIVLEGLLRKNYTELVDDILDKWIEMYQYNGIWEYHNPITGEGLGQEGLGMSLMIVDMLKRRNRVNDRI